MAAIFQPKGIEVRESPIHGQGIFAVKPFRAGETIEVAPVVLMTKADKSIIEATCLYQYYFVVGRSRKPVALGLGYSSLYNHAYRANATYAISLRKQVIIITAWKSIEAGEEVTLNYNGRPDDPAPVHL